MTILPATYPKARNSGGTVTVPLARDIVFGSNLTLTNLGNGSVQVDGSAGGGTPGGSSGQLQWNSGGAFAGAGFSAIAASGALLTLTAGADTDVPLLLKGHSATQSGDLSQWYNPAGALRGRVTKDANFSNPGGQTNSEVFGATASVSGTESVAIGGNAASQASSPTGRGVAIGYGATISGSGSGDSTAIGWGATCSGGRFGTAVGASSQATTNATAIGNGANASGNSSVCIGLNTSCNQTSGINVGNSNTHTAPNGVALGTNNTISGVAAKAFGTANTITHAGVTCLGTSLTSSRARELVIGCDTSNGLGAWTSGHRIRLASTTGSNTLRDLALIDCTWLVSTDATRAGAIALQAVDYGGTRTGVQVGSDGTQALLGFYGATAVAKQTLPASGSVTAADIRTALINLGLCA